VQSASWGTMTPLNGRDRGVILDIPGFSPRTETDRDVHMVSASPDYFATLGMALLLGRTFTARDGADAPKVAMLNETAARFYFGNTDPVGKKVVFATIKGAPSYEIVGVVKDAKHQSLRDQPWRFLYLPILQTVDRVNRLTLSVRCSNDAIAFAAPAAKQVLAARATLLITNISTIEKQVQISLMKERLVSTLSTAFGVLALVLACIGLYGVLAYAVTRRTGEIGIRMALGATRGEMMWLILREALTLALSGIVLGILPVLALGRVSRAMLYGVDSFDLPAFTIALLVLLAFAILAGVVPACRAARLDPASALRSE
jgi:predicted permease